MLKLFLHITLFVFLSIIAVKAQTCSKVSESIKLYQAKDLEGARKSIETASEDPTCSADPATWYYKAFIFKDFFRTKEINNKESKTRTLAIDAAKRNLELDPKNKFAEECKKIINYLALSYYNDAARELNDQKYEKSYSNYIKYLETIKISQPSKTDTTAIFYTGYTAFMSKNYSIAKQYLVNAQQLNYEDPNLYFYLGKVYWVLGEKDKSYEVLNTGLKKHPDNKEILLTMVNYYIEDGKLKNLESALEKAIHLEPENLDLKLSLAVISEKLMESEKSQQNKYFKKSEKLYEQVLNKDSTIFTPHFNLGLLYYNKAVTIINDSDYGTDLVELNKIQDTTVPLFKQAESPMLKAYRIKPKEPRVLEALAGIYFALGEVEKSNHYKKLLEGIK